MTYAPAKRPDPSTAEGQAIIRQELDAIHEKFSAAVADDQTRATEGVEAKPRLGDHYAAVRWRDLCEALDHAHSFKTFSLAHHLFTCPTVPWDRGLYPDQVALCSDAFAFGALKYGEVGGWRRDPVDTHLQAAGRHFDAWLKDPTSRDSESGFTHEAHFLARAMMLLELRRVAA